VLALKIGVCPQWTKTGHKFYTTMYQVCGLCLFRIWSLLSAVAYMWHVIILIISADAYIAHFV